MTECLAIQNTETGLWLIAVNDGGTYSWGNAVDAICFPTEAARQTVLDDLGNGVYKVGRPNDRHPNA